MLSDATIIEMLKNGKLQIKDFDENCLTPNGYDARVDEIYIESSNNGIIGAKKFFIVSTMEYFVFPDDIYGQIWLRTSWARKGILISAGLIDAGFEGKLNIMSFNSSEKEIEIKRGERYAQIIFMRMDRPAEKSYRKRSGHYFGQRGIIR